MTSIAPQDPALSAAEIKRGAEPAIKFAQQVLGEDLLMYAMDYPYQYVAGEVRTHDLFDVPEAVTKKLMQTNAQRVFKL